MGNCEICGKSTKHKYTYYQGDIVRSESKEEEDKIRVITGYANVEEVEAYLCVKCAKKSDLIYSVVLTSVYTVALTIIFFIRAGGKVTVVDIPIIALFSIIMIGCAVYMAKQIAYFTNDKKLRNEDGAKKIIEDAEKKNPDKKYFTPKELNSMKKL